MSASIETTGNCNPAEFDVPETPNMQPVVTGTVRRELHLSVDQDAVPEVVIVNGVEYWPERREHVAGEHGVDQVKAKINELFQECRQDPFAFAEQYPEITLSVDFDGDPDVGLLRSIAAHHLDHLGCTWHVMETERGEPVLVIAEKPD